MKDLCAVVGQAAARHCPAQKRARLTQALLQAVQLLIRLPRAAVTLIHLCPQEENLEGLTQITIHLEATRIEAIL